MTLTIKYPRCGTLNYLRIIRSAIA
ncbi:Com family DNA-binding transcriptional regulator [Collimonas sp. OK412]